MNEIEQVQDNSNATLSLFDSNHYSTLASIANMMAATSMTPETLRGTRSGQTFTQFSVEEVQANCFQVAEQAMRWNLSPFACAQHASIVRGRLMWEGKIVAAVLENATGVRLKYTYTGSGMNRNVVVSGRFSDETEDRTIEGTVKDWKTNQWAEINFDQRLAYRGAREWNRRHSPATMLGILTNDEELRRPDSRDVTPIRKTIIDPTQAPALEVEKVVEKLNKGESVDLGDQKIDLTKTPAVLTEPKKAAPTINEVECVIAECTVDSDDGLYVVTLTAGEKTIEARTSDAKIGGLCDFNKGGNVIAGLQQTTKGVKLTSIEIV